uniref:Uncharacterized protein n=1 Tax=Pelusios castaneus TaxID=367368 RepID=A0A8C8RNW6_9SAUR
MLDRLRGVIREWLTPLSLSVGFVASDDGQSVRRTGLALAHCLLRTLRGNRQIAEICGQEHYVLATYVDPRFKNNMASFVPEGESGLHRWTQRVINEVAENIRDVSDPGVSRRHAQQQRKGSASDRGRTLWDSLEDFGLMTMAPLLLDSAKAQAAQMVDGYLQDTVVLSASAEPLLYWQLKRDVWLPLCLPPRQGQWGSPGVALSRFRATPGLHWLKST